MPTTAKKSSRRAAADVPAGNEELPSFDAAAASSVIDDFVREDAEGKAAEKRTADERRLSSEKQYVELLLGIGENRPGDSSLLRDIALELDIDGPRLQADVAIIEEAIEAHAAWLQFEERRKRAAAAAEACRRQEKEAEQEADRLRHVLAVARSLQVESSKAPEVLSSLAGRRPLLFAGNPPRLRGAVSDGLVRAAMLLRRRKIVEQARRLVELLESKDALDGAVESIGRRLAEYEARRSEGRPRLVEAIFELENTRGNLDWVAIRRAKDALLHFDSETQGGAERKGIAEELRQARAEIARAGNAPRVLEALRTEASDLFDSSDPPRLLANADA